MLDVCPLSDRFIFAEPWPGHRVKVAIMAIYWCYFLPAIARSVGHSTSKLCPRHYCSSQIASNSRNSSKSTESWGTCTLWQLWVWKRAVRFLPHKIISFRQKNKVRQKYQNFIRLAPYKLGQTPLDKKFQKSNIILEGSRHPNFMNPFEYGE